MLIDCAVNAHSTTRQYDDVKVSIKSINNKNYFLFGISVFTVKAFSEALILASINPQYTVHPQRGSCIYLTKTGDSA